MPPTSMTPQERQERDDAIEYDYRNGLTIQEICATRGVSAAHVAKVARDRKLPRRRKPQEWYGQRNAAIYERLVAGDTYQAIANDYDISTENIYKMRIELGLPGRKRGPRPKSP